MKRCAAWVRNCCLAALLWQPLAATASDVHYVATPMNVVDAMLGLGAVGPADFLIDLGSGDGRISIRAATRFGTRGLGVDLDDSLVRAARGAAAKQGVSDRVAFETRNLFDTDLGRATVITAYLLPAVNLRLRPELYRQLRPGTRIVTHDFDFGDWLPDQKITVDVPDKPYGSPTSEIMLWVMPADASGGWTWALPGGVRHEAEFTQRFQMLRATVAAGGQRAMPGEGRVRGDAVVFTLGSAAGMQRYSGRISGNGIEGEMTVPGAAPVQWRATRIKAGKMDVGGTAGGGADTLAAARDRMVGGLIKERQ